MIIDTERIKSDAEYRNELRHRCITDHFFLAEMMGFKDFHPVLHKPVVDLYFPKNPNLPIQDQHRKKKRMHLDPRHTFKTTMGRVDTLQWILAFPETITILNETATQPLAAAISAGIAVYFWVPYGKGKSSLQWIFPELVVEGKKPEGKWNTPNHDPREIDSTLDYTSPKTTQSGWHPWIINPDDMVDAINSGIHAEDNVRKSVIDTYFTNSNLLRRGGYINLRGTRYHPFELYGKLIEQMDPDEWEVLIRGSLTVKSGRRMMPGEFPEEDDVILHFAELPNMDYKSLKRKFFEDYETFMCQQQNDPQGGSVPTFDEELFKTMQIPEERIPALGETFICWRLPYQGKEYMAQYAEGVAARIWEGKVYVLDAWQGTYTPSRLAQKIVEVCKHHQTGQVMMEDLPGIQYIETHIRNEAAMKNWSMNIQWLEYQEDDNDRLERMRNLEPQARAGRIWISTGTGKQTELRRQFLNFGLVVENGILDCVSRLATKIPVSLIRREMDEEEQELQIERRQRAMYHHIFCQQGGVDELEKNKREAEAAHAAAMQSVNTFGLRDILGGLDG